MAELISYMELLHGTQKAHLLIVTFQASDSVETENFIADNIPILVAIMTLAGHVKMVWIV